jgi:acetylornithine deacetylase
MSSSGAGLPAVDPKFVVDALSALVNVPSPTGSELACAEHMVETFTSLGMDGLVQSFAPDRANAVGVLRGTGGGRHLLLTGHMDTSYSGNEPGLDGPGYRPKAVIDGDILTGLGAANMKCGLAAALGAAHALQSAGSRLKGDLIIAGVAGEIEKTPVDDYQGQEYEGYGVGARYLVSHGVTADAAIVVGCTAFRVSLGHLGSVWLRINVHGDLLHTAKNTSGDLTHAVHEAMAVVQRLEEWIPEYQARNEFMGTRCGVTVGAVRAGNPTRISRTPQTCTLYLDVRYPPDVTAMQVKHEVGELLRTLQQTRPRLRFDLDTYMVAAPALLDQSEPLVDVTRKAATQILSEDRGLDYNVVVLDSRHLLDAGISTINFGVPRPDPNADKVKAGESIRISDVVKLAEIYTAIALDFCNAS